MMSMSTKRNGRWVALCPIATATAAVLICVGTPARAQYYSVNGAVSTTPSGGPPVPSSTSPQFVNISGYGLNVGAGASGSFSATSGANLTADNIGMGSGMTGSGTASVTGPGTLVNLGGITNRLANRLVVGEWGTGTLTVSGGAVIDATVNSAACAAPGANCYNFIDNGAGSTGTLTIDGPGSAVYTLRGFDMAHNYLAIDFGTPGGTSTATLNVTNGGLLTTQFSNIAQAATGTPSLATGTEHGNATVLISGANSRWVLSPDTIDGFGAFLNAGAGANSNAQITVSGGGSILIEGIVGAGPVSYLNLGSSGGTADLQVTGPNSQVIVSGSANRIFVGTGLGSVGTMEVSNQGLVSTTSLAVGDRGAAGTVSIDNATVALTGYRADLVNQGAGASVGRGTGGNGTLSLTNGAQLTITNSTFKGGMSIGGDSYYSGGTGSVTLNTGSSIQLLGAIPSAVTVGYNGTGTMSLINGSSLNAGAGSVYIGLHTGSIGTLSLASNSTLTANYVGVASTPGVDSGGNATVTLMNSTVNAPTFEIGTHGVVEGSNSVINGTVINRGTIIADPPGQPGTLIVNGSFQSGVGGNLILDIAADSHGGFTTSRLALTAGSTFDFTGMKVTFDFLGSTDPTAFLDSGAFVLDTFLQSLSAGGIYSGLSDAFSPDQTYDTWFTSEQFSATSDAYTISGFTFDPTGTAVFSAAAVPEPETWTLLVVGLAALCFTVPKSSRRTASGRLS